MSIEIALIPVTDFQQNCRVLYDSESREAVVFDPGGDSEKIISFLNSHGLNLQAVYLTHSHIDHCGGVAALLRDKQVDLYGHEIEKVFRQNVTMAATMYGLTNRGLENCPEPTHFLKGGETIQILGQEVEIFFTPGHSPGSVSYWFKNKNWLFSGDVLFKGSIGRTDVPAGDHQALMQSIRSLIKQLPAEAHIFCGHGPDSLLGQEAETNPFLI
jgi:hydroxyacylglutathione hydrolase